MSSITATLTRDYFILKQCIAKCTVNIDTNTRAVTESVFQEIISRLSQTIIDNLSSAPNPQNIMSLLSENLEKTDLKINSIMSPVLDSLPTYKMLIESKRSGLAKFVTNQGVIVPVKVLLAKEEISDLNEVKKLNLTQKRANENDIVSYALRKSMISDHTPIIRVDTEKKIVDISYNILWKCRYDPNKSTNNGFLHHENNIATAVARQKQGIEIAKTICSELKSEAYTIRSIRFQEINRPSDFAETDMPKELVWKKYVAQMNEINAMYNKEYHLFVGGYLHILDLDSDVIREDLFDCEVLTMLPINKGAQVIPLPEGCIRLNPANCQIVRLENDFLVNLHLKDDKFNHDKEFNKRDDDTVEDLKKIVEKVGKEWINARIVITGDFNKVEDEEATGLASNGNNLEKAMRNEITRLISKLNDKKLGKSVLSNFYKVSFNPVPGSHYNGSEGQGQSPDWYIEITPKTV